MLLKKIISIMFEQYDPGFLPAFIGLVIGSTFTFILQQITVLCSFQEQLESLQKHVDYHDKQISPRGNVRELDRLVQNASEMVKQGRNVPCFDVFSRHRMSKNMNKLISAIEDEKYHVLVDMIIIQQAIIKIQQALPGAAEKMPAKEQTEPAPPVTTEKMPGKEQTEPAPTITTDKMTGKEQKESAPPVTTEEMSGFMHQASIHIVNAAEVITIDPHCCTHIVNIDQHATTSSIARLPTYDEEPIPKWLSSKNDASFHKLLGTLINMNFTSEKQLMRVKELVPMIRQELKSHGYNNNSALGRWLERLDQLLDRANEMAESKEPGRGILQRYGWSKRINCLLSQITVHVKLIPLTVLGLER